MEKINRGSVSLLYFTVRWADFDNLYPRPQHSYFLVTQVFNAEDEYLCTQLLGIDLRAVKYLEKQGCEHRMGNRVGAADRERIQSCLDQYARALINKVADNYRHIAGIVATKHRIQ